MANNPGAKKAIRKIARRTEVNKARRSRVRTFVRKFEEAIEAGGSTLRDHRQADGELGYFQHAFAVYDREGAACRHKGCEGAIARVAQNGRSTFYCPECQK